MLKRSDKKSRSLPILLFNIFILAAAFFMIGRYVLVYQEKLREENLSNIANLNASAANNATALMDSWRVKLGDIAGYVARHDMTRDELLILLEETNSSPSRQFQLIGSDYTGFLARRDDAGAFIPLTYTSGSYMDLQAVFDNWEDSGAAGIRFTPEFTDQYSARKCFALFTHITLVGEGGEKEPWTLLLAGQSRDVLSVFNNQNVFEGLSNILIDGQGNYIVSSPAFKSVNLFQFFYVYNDLSLDQRNAVRDQVLSTDSGTLYYKNGEGADSVFFYKQLRDSDWSCVTTIPLASFRTAGFSSHYAIYAIISILLLLGVDVLWLRRLNARLRVSVAREKEASSAKTDFLSRMSHDIRTPLNGVIGMTILASDEDNPPQTAEYLSNIKACGDFLLGLVNDILDLSKVESGKMDLRPERYSTADFTRYLDAVIAPLCRDKGLEFHMIAPGDDMPLMLDRLRFNQIFFNLLSNAVKYTPSGGHITLSWSRAALTDGRMALDFVVRDDGVGMSADFQQRMFEAFSQEHTVAGAQGTGLGLAIVWNLVKLMGGSISVDSAPGKGTAFFLHLEADECHAEAAAPAPVDLRLLKGKRALLCEDNHLNAVIAERFLLKWDMLAEIAENGRIGVEKFAESAPNYYDVVLMDIQMPEMNGLEAARAIRALDRPDANVPILAMTANTYGADIDNCLAAGMNAHMGKPLEPAVLRDMLLKFMRGAPETDAAS